MVNILAGYYETEILNKYTKANFDNIYKDLLTIHWDISYEFDDGENLEKSISDLNLSDEYKKALGVLGDGMERTLVIVEGEEETK